MFNNDGGFTMPVVPAYGGVGSSGSGFLGGDGIWAILLFALIFGFGGFGGFGGGFGGFGNAALGYDFPWILNGQQGVNNNVSSGFRDAQLNDGITSIRDGLSSLSTQLCGCCGDMQMALANGFANAETAANARQMATMQQNFGLQTAMSQGFNGVQLQQCQASGENRLAIAGIGSDIAREACATRTSDMQNTQAILGALNAGVQSIKDQICADKIEQKNDTIAQLRSELMYARGQASQDIQTAAIQLGQRNLANEVEQYVAPRAIPAYVVQNPNCCYNACGCGSF